ncbi:MAG: hypothetical protein ACJA0V_001995 [Planctomycetota bacterium]|jgi:hypothetical protein
MAMFPRSLALPMTRLTAVLSALLLSASFAGAQAPAASSSSPANLALASLESASPASAAREDLRVLFVGQDATDLKIMFSSMAVPRTRQLYRERTAAWESLLRYHFEHVTVVHGEDYRVEMSDDVDVTIFDVPPKALTAVKRGTDPDTGKSTYQAATYLPESFDRPAIMISASAPRIGEPLGLKLDWL